MNFSDYVTEHGEERTAETLSALLGSPVSTAYVRARGPGRTRKPPKKWIEALGLESPPAEDPGEDLGGSSPGLGTAEADGKEGRRAETPPKAPKDAVIARPPLTITAQARERIAALHVFAGASIATAADAEGFENDRGVGGGIAKLWTDKSDPIAEAWIAWAEEGNKFAQSFIRLMGTGGAGGTLALGYASLLGGTAYILGHMPDNEATRVVYGRYAKYRTVVPAEPRRESEGPRPSGRASAESRDNGAAAQGAADVLGGVARPFGQ